MSSVNQEGSYRGKWRYWTDEHGQEWKFKRNQDWTYGDWEEVEAPPEEERAVYLYVVQESQADGEPNHWSLFVAPEQGPGNVFQVTGDRTFMYYSHMVNANIRVSETYLNAYQIATLDQNGTAWVDYYANNTAPPQAADRASVIENCQGWLVRVLRALQAKGVVKEKTVDSVASSVQPI